MIVSIQVKIKEARKAAGLTQAALAELIGVPKTTLASWEQGRGTPKPEAFLALVSVLDLGEHGLNFSAPADDWDGPDFQKCTIQVLGYVGAGGDISPIDDHAHGSGLEEVECPPDTAPGTVAVIVRGDSMYPLLNDGSLIFFSRREKNLTDHFHRLVIVHFADGRKAVKGLNPGTRRGVYTLTSTNKAPMVDQDVESVSPIDWIKPN